MEIYEKPAVKVVEYSRADDIITTSGTNNNSLDNGDDYNIVP